MIQGSNHSGFAIVSRRMTIVASPTHRATIPASATTSISHMEKDHGF